jgi:hypothetical protein
MFKNTLDPSSNPTAGRGLGFFGLVRVVRDPKNQKKFVSPGTGSPSRKPTHSKSGRIRVFE